MSDYDYLWNSFDPLVLPEGKRVDLEIITKGIGTQLPSW